MDDVEGLHKILGDCLITFMQKKPQPYLARALRSKDDFWNVPVFKRALTFVFLIRYVLGYNSQCQWKKFSEADLKLNSRCFRRWVAKDRSIIEQSPLFLSLPDHPDSDTGDSVPKKRRKRGGANSFSSDSPMKRKYVVLDSSSDEDDE